MRRRWRGEVSGALNESSGSVYGQPVHWPASEQCFTARVQNMNLLRIWGAHPTRHATSVWAIGNIPSFDGSE
jgi:hypothetical protein